MGGVKKSITAVVVALAAASVVHADMMPLSPLEGEARQTLPAGDEAVSGQPCDSGRSVEFFDITDLDPPSAEYLPEARTDAADAGATKHVEVLTDTQNSLSLCLYALLGLGFCRSAPSVKKLSFGVVPEWYRNDGPYQIGHSFAIAPDCRSATGVFCFPQPDSTAENVTPQYSSGTIAALQRESQFDSTILASRGPPSLTHESSIASRTYDSCVNKSDGDRK